MNTGATMRAMWSNDRPHEAREVVGEIDRSEMRQRPDWEVRDRSIWS